MWLVWEKNHRAEEVTVSLLYYGQLWGCALLADHGVEGSAGCGVVMGWVWLVVCVMPALLM